MKVNTGNTKEALTLAGGTQAGTTGSSTAVGTTSLTNSGASWTTNQWAGKFVITGGTYGVIVSNTSTALTIDQWYNPTSPTGAAASNPSTGSYVILGGAAPVDYMALTNTSSFTPSATDTSLSGEQTANGLGRKLATFTYTTGASSYQLAATWTYTGSSPVTITGIGTFDCLTASSGVMLHETALSSSATVSANGDTLTVTQTVTM